MLLHLHCVHTAGECFTCEQTPDALEKSWSRLRTYEAISSPEYICQTSKDPILTAFELSSEFNVLAEMNDGTFRVNQGKSELQ